MTGLEHPMFEVEVYPQAQLSLPRAVAAEEVCGKKPTPRTEKKSAKESVVKEEEKI
jgi:hypothetical protein